MSIAKTVATRATCDRKQVGAVLVRDRIVLSTGYNGVMSGMPHCDEVGHELENDHCVGVVHAEINAICQAARRGVAIEGSTCYCTASPCWSCFKALVNAGIRSIFYTEFYRDERIFEAAKRLGITLTQVTEVETDHVVG
jgi:dCMP deaminase